MSRRPPKGSKEKYAQMRRQIEQDTRARVLRETQRLEAWARGMCRKYKIPLIGPDRLPPWMAADCYRDLYRGSKEKRCSPKTLAKLQEAERKWESKLYESDPYKDRKSEKRLHALSFVYGVLNEAQWVRREVEKGNWVEVYKHRERMEDEFNLYFSEIGQKIRAGGYLGFKRAYPREKRRELKNKYAGWERDLIKLAKELPVGNLSLTTLYRILAKRNSLKSPDTIRHHISKNTRELLKQIIRFRKTT